MRLSHLSYLVIMIIFLQSCRSIKTHAPEETYTPFILKPQLSTINLPLEISETQFENMINSYLTGVLYEDNNLNDDNMMLKVTKLNNITLDVVGEEFRYNVPLKVWLKVGMNIEKFGMSLSESKEANCSMMLHLITKVRIANDWSVSSTTTLSGYEWITKPTIDLGLFDMPLTYVADKVIDSQKAKLLSLLDQQTTKYLQLKSYIEPAWTKIQDPISLTTDPESWLSIQPVVVQMSPFMGRGGMIQSSVGLKAFLYYHLGTKPGVSFTPLPKLTNSKDETGSFSFSLVSDIDYDYAEKLSKSYFEGQIYEFDNGKKKIKIEAVKLYGNNGKLIVGMTLSGSLNGTVYVNSVPYYDAPTKSVRVKDLDFDIDTKNKLVKSANWLAHGVFLKRMQENLVFSLKDNLKEAETMVQKNLSNNKINDYVTLDGRLTQLQPESIFLTDKGISAVLNAKGLLYVKLNIK